MGQIRVVGGALRGRRIAVPERGVRPTSERTREAIFALLGPGRVEGARVLDLYAGTGALGIEALSRGATFADFVEKDAATARRLTGTLETLGLSERARVHRADLGAGVLPAAAAGPWAIVFLDPPYADDAGAIWLAAIARAAWIAPGGFVVYERGRATEAGPPEGLPLWKERTYGDTTVAIFRTGRIGRIGQSGPKGDL
jgi:16S rRNA (guanine(966)-N(2))-methyltransferase RsmD